MIAGLCELFQICMIWLILDYDSSQTVYSDGQRNYAILDVVNTRVSANADDDSGDETVQVTTITNDSLIVSVSDLMIAQFFDQVLEREEDWDPSEDKEEVPDFYD